ncbi:MAG: hypothetical protein FGM52_01360, partial [Mycobacterium sp.]|nr:hypothetical protein [Mycobacterium sp.]
MLRRFWAVYERILPRGVVALATVAAAAVTDPQSLGLYNWAALAVTLIASVTDLPIRHLAVIHIGSPTGRRYLHRYAILAGGTGCAIMIAAVWLVASLAFTGPTLDGILLLCPLILIPPAQALAVQPVAQLQRAGLWAQVSLSRTISSVSGAAVGLPVVFLSRSVFGASLALAFSELIFAALVIVQARRLGSPGDESPGHSGPGIAGFWSTYRHMTYYNALGWVQGQAERVFLGLWAGTGALGMYSLG